MALPPYIPQGDILKKFVFSDARVSIIQGPIGSGTSSALVGRMMRHVYNQKPNSSGIRRSRWYVSRPTYSALQRSFFKTYSHWMGCGVVTPPLVGSGPITHRITPDLPCAQLSDGTRLDFELIGLAVLSDEGPTYYSELLDSTEMTGWILNEAQDYVQKTAIDYILGRVEMERYPAAIEGGPTWAGLLVDLNAPPHGHWIPYMRGEVPFPQEWSADVVREYDCPEHWEFFIQPAGLIEKHDVTGRFIGYEENPLAENLPFRKRPYLQVIKGKPKHWIEQYVMNRAGTNRVGDPVFPEFSLTRNVSADIKPVEGLPLIVGIDAARNPFATVWQNVRGSWRCYSELGMRGVAATTFAPALKRHLFERYGSMLAEDSNGRVVGANFWVDPSATRKGDGSDDSFWSVMREFGLMCNAAPGNNKLELRRGAVQNAILRVTPDEAPGLIVHATGAPTLKTALHTGYILTEENVPDKKKSGIMADAADSAQYALLGGGEGQAVVGGNNHRSAPVTPKRKKFKHKRRG